MMALEELNAATDLVHSVLAPTPQIAWPLLTQATGCETWVKHENHTPIGAFKIRGGLVYLASLQRSSVPVITATRGNHGQSVAFAARRLGLRATIVVPHGNSPEKNAAMRALGADLVEEGHDFQAAAEYARSRAEAEHLHFVPSFHPLLVQGVASYAVELFRAVERLDTVYVPIGMGSGICGVIAARNALGLTTKVVGVVAEGAPAYALSFNSRERIATATAETMADGLACRVPDPEALAVIFHGVERIVQVSDAAIEAAVRLYFTATHNVAEGAGAAPLAGLLAERDRQEGKRVGVVLTGGNIDREVFSRVLAVDA